MTRPAAARATRAGWRLARRGLGALVALLGVVGAASAADVDGRSVLLVVNTRVAASGELAEEYRRLRAVPESQVVTVDVPVDSTIARDAYERDIAGPVARWLADNGATDRITFVVLMPGLPLRVGGTVGRDGTSASVDSELALLYRQMTGAVVARAGRVPNPYFTADAIGATPRPFDRRAYDIYLVTRLDGSTTAATRALLARGRQRASGWQFVVDGRAADRSGAERRWLADVPGRLADVAPRREGLATVFDETAAVATAEGAVTGYYSWGSNDTRTRTPPVSFGPAAVAASFMSADARTLTSPPAQWMPGRWDRRDSFYAGGPEALAVDWLDAGLTGLGAMVGEPYLDAAFRPATLFEAWTRGYTLAESFYMAMPFLSWQAVVFGDPLARAADGTWPSPEATDIDDASGEPALFQARRVAAMRTRLGLPSDAVTARWLAALKANALEPKSGVVRDLLEQVVAEAPRFVAGHVLLADVHTARGDHDLARASYRTVLAIDPNHVIALNNLAYNLAVQAGDVDAAVPLADRLMRLGQTSPTVLDTVGWVWHLAGRSQAAAEVLSRATRTDPTLCDGLDHYAQVLTALGRSAEAARVSAQLIACRAPAAPTPPR